MRRVSYWGIVLAACSYSGFMAVYVASSIPSPETIGPVQTFVWIVFSAIVLAGFWLVPMLGLWCLARYVKPRRLATVTVRQIHREPDADMARDLGRFCEKINSRRAERHSEPCVVDGQVVAFRPRARKSGN